MREEDEKRVPQKARGKIIQRKMGGGGGRDDDMNERQNKQKVKESE